MKHLFTFSFTNNNDNQVGCTFFHELILAAFKPIFKIAFSLLFIVVFKPCSFGQAGVVNFNAIDQTNLRLIAYNNEFSSSDIPGSAIGDLVDGGGMVPRGNIFHEGPERVTKTKESVTEFPEEAAKNVLLRISSPIQSTAYKIDEEHLEINSLEKGEVLYINSIYFATASSKPLDLTGLDQLVDLLQSYPYLKVVLKGLADSRGENDYNLSLAQSRADRVKQLIMKAGVDAGRIEAVATGESRVINESKYAASYLDKLYAQNRRVDFLIQVNTPHPRTLERKIN